MPIIAMLLAAQSMPVAAPVRACRPAQLRLSLDGRDGDFNGMSHSGIEISIHNLGPDCMLPALPAIELRDAHGRMLPAVRRAVLGPVMAPVRLSRGHRATADLRWVSGPVYPHSRSARAASVAVRIGKAVIRAPLTAVLYGEASKPVSFDQTPLRESVPAG